MKVLVCGGSGYIGSHVVKELLAKKHHVTVYDNCSTGTNHNLFDKAHYIKADILDKKALHEAMQGQDAVIHLAGKKNVGESMKDPIKYTNTNLIGSIHILEAMVQCKVKYIVFSSTCSLYGEPQYLPLDEKHPTNALNYYAQTKLDIEKLIEWFATLKEIKYVVFRYFNAAGYDENKIITGLEQNSMNLLPILIESALGMRPGVQVYGDDYNTRDGTCIRDYIHVTDLATAHEQALHYIEKNKSVILNLGTENGISVKEMIEKTKKITKKEFKVNTIEKREGDPSTLIGTAQKAKHLLGWSPIHSDIDNIIRTTWAMYNP